MFVYISLHAVTNCILFLKAATPSTASSEPRHAANFASVLSAFPGLPLANPTITTGSVRTPPPNDDTEFAQWRQFFLSLGPQGRRREFARLVRVHAALVSA